MRHENRASIPKHRRRRPDRASSGDGLWGRYVPLLISFCRFDRCSECTAVYTADWSRQIS